MPIFHFFIPLVPFNSSDIVIHPTCFIEPITFPQTGSQNYLSQFNLFLILTWAYMRKPTPVWFTSALWYTHTSALWENVAFLRSQKCLFYCGLRKEMDPLNSWFPLWFGSLGQFWNWPSISLLLFTYYIHKRSLNFTDIHCPHLPTDS